MHVVTTVVGTAAETIMVVIATAAATINSATSVSAITASVVTVVALTVLAVTAAADSVVQRLAAEAKVDKVLCRRNDSIRGWQLEQHCSSLVYWSCELAEGTTAT